MFLSIRARGEGKIKRHFQTHERIAMEIKKLSSRMTVLSVGAAGNVAGLVVPALVERGVKVRALVRKSEQIAEAKRRGATEVAIGDL